MEKKGNWKSRISKNGVVKVVDMEMEKMEGKEGLKMKNKGRFAVKVNKVSEKGRNLTDFGEEWKVLSEVFMEVLERKGSV